MDYVPDASLSTGKFRCSKLQNLQLCVLANDSDQKSIYGMNLFVFNQQTMKIMIANDFWIYIATWIPLTLLTFLGYGLVVLRHKSRAENGWHWLSISNSSTLKGP